MEYKSHTVRGKIAFLSCSQMNKLKSRHVIIYGKAGTAVGYWEEWPHSSFLLVHEFPGAPSSTRIFMQHLILPSIFPVSLTLTFPALLFYVCTEYCVYVCVHACVWAFRHLWTYVFMGLNRMNYNFLIYHHEYFPLLSLLQHILLCLLSLWASSQDALPAISCYVGSKCKLILTLV